MVETCHDWLGGPELKGSNASEGEPYRRQKSCSVAPSTGAEIGCSPAGVGVLPAGCEQAPPPRFRAPVATNAPKLQQSTVQTKKTPRMIHPMWLRRGGLGAGTGGDGG